MHRCLLILSIALATVACTPGESLPSASTFPHNGTTSSQFEASTTPASPTAADVYRMVAPSLGFVETPLSTGSGIFIGDGLLVTNAHVVWPYRRVKVSFFESGEGRQLDVVGVDWSADLALVDVSAIADLPHPTVLTSTRYSPGDRVYLIGFPAEDPDSPEPSITTGIVSRTRTWDDGDLRFIQSDALISGGQSGGALVDAFGAVIGITSLEIGEGFALALDAADVATRVEDMRSGRDPSGVGDRWLEDLDLGDRARLAEHFLDEIVWRFDTEPGDDVLIEVKAQTSLSGSIIGPDGFLEATLEGGVLAFEAELAGPHFLAVVPDAGFDSRIDLVTDVVLTPLDDPDHGVAIGIGEVRFGNVDYPGDLDWFTIPLEEGDELVILASSPNADMGLYVGPLLDLSGDAARSDSDSGAGVIGADAELRYTAMSSGTHIIGVFDETQFGPGAYALRVDAG